MTERYPNVFKVVIRQIGQDGKAEVILGKKLRVLCKTKLLKPIGNLLHRHPGSGDVLGNELATARVASGRYYAAETWSPSTVAPGRASGSSGLCCVSAGQNAAKCRFYLQSLQPPKSRTFVIF